MTKTIQKGFTFRLYPNKEQKILIAKTIGCGRFVYNHFLALWNETYKNTGKGLSYAKCSAACTKLKASIPWLKEVDAHALQSSLKDLSTAFDRFFKKESAYPRFKKKASFTQTYRTNLEKKNQLPHVSIQGNRLKLPKLGWIRFANSQKIDGRLINATVRRTPSGEYFASILAETTVHTFNKTDSAIGIDVGLATFAVVSDGTTHENPRFFKQIEKKLQKEQRILSRRRHLAVKQKRKLSEAKNYQKQRRKVARIYEKMVNIRTDYLHKTSTELVKNHDLIGVEDLAVSDMIQDKQYAKGIQEVSWSLFKTMLTYKAEWYGKQVVAVDRYYASSQLCSNCGNMNEGVKDTHIREWTCPSCRVHHDRDLNASVNIRNEALRLTAGTAGIA